MILQKSTGTENRGERREKHARLPAQVPAFRVSKKPGGNERQERKDAVSGQEDKNHETSDKLVSIKANRKGDYLLLEEDHSALLNNVKAAAAVA